MPVAPGLHVPERGKVTLGNGVGPMLRQVAGGMHPKAGERVIRGQNRCEERGKRGGVSRRKSCAARPDSFRQTSRLAPDDDAAAGNTFQRDDAKAFGDERRHDHDPMLIEQLRERCARYFTNKPHRVAQPTAPGELS